MDPIIGLWRNFHDGLARMVQVKLVDSGFRPAGLKLRLGGLVVKAPFECRHRLVISCWCSAWLPGTVAQFRDKREATPPQGRAWPRGTTLLRPSPSLALFGVTTASLPSRRDRLPRPRESVSASRVRLASDVRPARVGWLTAEATSLWSRVPDLLLSVKALRLRFSAIRIHFRIVLLSELGWAHSATAGPC